MNKKLYPKSSLSISGFSLVEMLIASALVVLLSATSYRILTGQGTRQRESVWGQKKNSMMLTALDLFRVDVRKTDPNWLRYGISFVYPAQGYGFGENFYVDLISPENGLNDGVTFLRRDPEKADLFSLSNNATAPVAIAPADQLYGDWLNLNEPSTTIEVNDWVLLFQPGRYVLGVVTDVGESSPARIKIRQPNAQETVSTFTNVWGRSSGFVTGLGVVPGSYDWNAANTASIDDDTITMEGSQTKVQVVQPVSYGIEWATSDGKPHTHGAGNSYLLDDQGNRKKMLSRIEFTGTGLSHQYVSEVAQVGLTYDALSSNVDGSTSLSGYTDGDIVKNIGRESTTAVQFVNLTVAPDENEGFISTSRILSLRMFLSSDTKSNYEEKMKYNEVHVAVDPGLNNDRYQEDGQSIADNSGNLTETTGLNEQQIGQPLSLKYPGSDQIHILAPVSYLHDASNANSFQNGKLVVYDSKGCPVMSSSCSPDAASEITFQSPTPNSYFYPHNMTQLGDETTTKIMVGGMMVVVDDSVNPPAISQKPAIAQIEFSATETLADVMKANATAGTSGTFCSLSGCNLQYLDTSNLSSDASSRFMDTAGGIATKDNDIYVASLTHEDGSDSQLSIFKTSATGSTLNPVEEVIVDTSSGYAEGRVISAISQSPIVVGTDSYLPICMSRKLKTGGTAQDDGVILLYNLAGTATAPIPIANHNYSCTNLQTLNGEDLLIGGKLVTQYLKHGDIAALVNGSTTDTPMFMLDEVADVIEGPGTKIYADAYYTLPTGYSEPVAEDYQQVLGWNLGVSVQQISQNEFGIVLGNRALISKDTVKGTSIIDQQDFTTMKVTFGGMGERVLASIDTNADLNKSTVTVQYGEAEFNAPNTLLPGIFSYNSTAPRETLAPLPNLGNGNMTGSKLFEFFQDYIDMRDLKTGAAVAPVPDKGGSGSDQCTNSIPTSCGDSGGVKAGGGGAVTTDGDDGAMEEETAEEGTLGE